MEKVATIVWMYKTDTFSLVKLFWLWTKADGLECCYNNYAVILLMTCLLCQMSLKNQSTIVLQSTRTRMMAKSEDDKIQQPRTKSPSRLMGPYGVLFISASLRIITRATRCLTWCHLHLFHKDWEMSWCFFLWVTCAAATVSYDAQLIGNMSNWAQRVNNTSPRGGPSLSWCAAGSTFQELACHIYFESDMSCYISGQQYLSFALFCCFMLFLLSCS